MIKATVPRRRMNPMNRVYWYYDQMVNANSCEWIEVEGILDERLLREAALILTRRHPVLNARLEVGTFNYSWVEDAADLPIDIRIERLPGQSLVSVHDQLVANIWGERLPLLKGRPFRIHVTELGTTTVLQVITTHVFTDGLSANTVVRDLVRAYNSLHDGCPWTPERVDVPDRNPAALFTNHLPFRRRVGLSLAALGAVAREAAGRAGRVGLGRAPRGKTDVVLTDLGSKAFDDVRRASAAMGISRHPFYVAAALRTIQAYNAKRGLRPDRRVLKIIDNFSLRRFALKDVSDLYDLCSIPYSLYANGALDDASLIRDVSAQVERLRSGEVLSEVFRQSGYKLSATLSPKVMATRLVGGLVLKSNFFLSNIGPVPEGIDAFGDANISNYYSFSQLFPPGQLMFFLSTRGASLRIVCLFDRGNFIREEVVDELVNGFALQLQSICQRQAGVGSINSSRVNLPLSVTSAR